MPAAEVGTARLQPEDAQVQLTASLSRVALQEVQRARAHHDPTWVVCLRAEPPPHDTAAPLGTSYGTNGIAPVSGAGYCCRSTGLSRRSKLQFRRSGLTPGGCGGYARA